MKIPKQRIITFKVMRNETSKKLSSYAEKNERSLSNVVKLCVLSHFGTDEEIAKAISILENIED